MTVLFFDVETTGLKRDNLPHIDPAQPMPVQLGMKLDAENGREMGVANTLIQPEDWIIQPGASAIHGITAEIAKKYGVHLITAVEHFLDFIASAEIVVAHNMAFDAVVMRRATFVYSEMVNIPYVDPFAGKTLVCTMLAACPIVKAKPKKFGTWKWPKLEEAMKFFFNETLEGAHDALVDVKGCARVFTNLERKACSAMDNKQNPLNPKRTSELCRELTEDAQMTMNALASRLNEVNFLRAIQKGYEMACRDNGLPLPSFEDPLKALMRKL